jgi:hypothetical protein
VPVNVIVVPPLVGMLLPPATALIEGTVYDTVDDNTALVWEPTLTSHFKLAPTPATLAHLICVFATLTMQPLALYVVPLTPPYVALTAFPLVGPKLVPVNVIVEPPPVPTPLPATPVITGGVYETAPDDTALA